MTYNVTIFGIHLKLNTIAFSIPLGSRHWDIYWYGIIIATGFLLALIYAIKNAKRFGIDTDRMLDIVLVVTPVANRRPAPQAHDYIRPIPTDQIQLFQQNGYVLEQNPEWK